MIALLSEESAALHSQSEAAMPIAILRFTLPDEESEFRTAQQGQAAKAALSKIDQHCRSIVRHGEPTPEERRLAEEIRSMIPCELREG